jgi:hypothetical protein
MRASAYTFLRDEHPLSSSIEVLAEAASEVAGQPIAAAVGRSRYAFPLPKAPEIPPTEYERISRGRTDFDDIRMRMKKLMFDQRETRRALHDLQVVVSGRDSEEDAVEWHGPRSVAPPRVSVVITVFNDASLVGAAIDSVAASEYVDYELIILDDASSDGSDDAIRTALAHAPWVTATVITRPHNKGLAQARNLGAETAAGELLLVLDADNAVYPHALGRLVQAMDDMPAAVFAYGIVEQFGIDGPTSLTSYLGWDPGRLRYGSFIDAIAMVRRSALLEVGGYTVDPRLYGWEHFALWCTFAHRGWDGVRVPEIVARYRLALHSTISFTDIDASAVWSLLLDRFAFLSVSPNA